MFLKLSHEMLYHAMVSENPCGLSLCSHPPPKKIGSLVEIAFCRFLLHISSVLAVLLHARIASSKVPRVRKSPIHPRNFDSHVTVRHARPSAPQTYQCKITQSTGMAAQMQLQVFWRGIARPRKS